MPDGKRLWRTEQGDLVEDGHPEAVLLAYGEDDPLDDGDKVRGAAKSHTPKSEVEATPKKTAAAKSKASGK